MEGSVLLADPGLERLESSAERVLRIDLARAGKPLSVIGKMLLAWRGFVNMRGESQREQIQS